MRVREVEGVRVKGRYGMRWRRDGMRYRDER